MAITFGDSVFSWSSASEVTLWVMAGVLFLVFGLAQALHPLIDAQYKLYPTLFLRRPLIVILGLSMFMASVSLLVGHAIYVLERLHKASLNAIPDPSILYPPLLSIRPGMFFSFNPLQLRSKYYSGFLSYQLRGTPPPLRH